MNCEMKKYIPQAIKFNLIILIIILGADDLVCNADDQQLRNPYFELQYGKEENICKDLTSKLNKMDEIPYCDAINIDLSGTINPKIEELDILDNLKLVKEIESYDDSEFFQRNHINAYSPTDNDAWLIKLKERLRSPTNHPLLYRINIDQTSSKIANKNWVYAYKMNSKKCNHREFSNWANTNGGMTYFHFKNNRMNPDGNDSRMFMYNNLPYLISSGLTSRTHYWEWKITINEINDIAPGTGLLCYIVANGMFPPPPEK